MSNLLEAAKFSLSVHRAQGLFDMSEQVAARKLEAAIAEGEVATKPPAEIHWLDLYENSCCVLEIVGSEEDGKRLLVKFLRLCELQHDDDPMTWRPRGGAR